MRTSLENEASENLSFAVAAVSMVGPSEFIPTKDRLKAALRRQQLSSLSDPYPKSSGNQICPVDLVRPVGSEKMYYKTKNAALSTSALAKRKSGLHGKQSHIAGHIDQDSLGEISRALLAKEKSAPFALLLSSISEGAAPPEGLRTNLHDKIAVIHIDGNGFGGKQDDFIGRDNTDPIGRQKLFDETLVQMRRALVTPVLTLLEKQGGIGTPSEEEQRVREDVKTFSKGPIIRMEMLLWGGDEMTFIVPARLGWSIASAMMAAIKDHWKLDEEAPLSASIGLVFCHHDAPIARIRGLADELAGRTKNTKGRGATHIWPMVLESFDHVGGQVDHYLEQRVRLTDEKDRNAFFLLTSEQFSGLQMLADTLAADETFCRMIHRKQGHK